MHSVLETDTFARAAKRVGLSEDERFRIVSELSDNPKAGDLIVGAGGARKIRFAAPGRGKRGGYRVVTYYAADDVPVFLMDLYEKGERIDLTQAERNELKKILKAVADDYRRSVREKMKSLAERAS